jgi:hypothetical protein
LWKSPERNRLSGAIDDFAIELKHTELKSTKESGPNEVWFLKSQEHLNRARDYLIDDNLHQGWAALQSAQRAFLLDPSNPDRPQRAAISLFYELKKVSDWRADAIRALICDEKGALLKAIPPAQVVEAVAHRDDQFQTNYFKIMLRRRHLQSLFLVLIAGLADTLILSYAGHLPDPLSNFNVVAGVILFGALGAGLSVARGLLSANISAKIPSQQLGAFVIWMRPAIGAAAALISFVLLSAKVFRVFDWNESSAATIFTVAIAAGFSERFIVGAIERLASQVEETKEEKSDKSRKGKAMEASARASNS